MLQCTSVYCAQWTSTVYSVSLCYSAHQCSRYVFCALVPLKQTWRNVMFSSIDIPGFSDFTDRDKFIYLLTSRPAVKAVSQFIWKKAYGSFFWSVSDTLQCFYCIISSSQAPIQTTFADNVVLKYIDSMQFYNACLLHSVSQIFSIFRLVCLGRFCYHLNGGSH